MSERGGRRFVEQSSEQIVTIFYVDGGVSKKRDPKFPCYGSYRGVDVKIENGKEKIVTAHEQHWLQHKNAVRTNNQSEYAALIELLNYLKDSWHGNHDVLIRMDSEFVVKSFNGESDVSSDNVRTLCAQARSIRDSCPFKIHLMWVTGDLMKAILGH